MIVDCGAGWSGVVDGIIGVCGMRTAGVDGGFGMATRGEDGGE